MRSLAAIRALEADQPGVAARLAASVTRVAPARAADWHLQASAAEAAGQPCDAVLHHARVALSPRITARDGRPEDARRRAWRRAVELAGLCDGGVRSDLLDAATAGWPTAVDRRRGSWLDPFEVAAPRLSPADVATLLPHDATARTAWAETLWRRGHLDAALDALTEVDDPSSRALWIRGEVLAAQGGAAAAASAWRDAVERDADALLARWRLAGATGAVDGELRVVPSPMPELVASEEIERVGDELRLYVNGSVTVPVTVPEGAASAVLVALVRGMAAAGGYTVVDVFHDGQALPTVEATAATLPLPVDLGSPPPATAAVTLHFGNDLFDAPRDRNLIVEGIVLLARVPGTGATPR